MNRQKRRAMPLEFTDNLEQKILDLNAKGISCKEIARTCGVERKSVYGYRDGKTTPDAFFLLSFCKNYNVSADRLLGLKFNYWKLEV